MVRRKPDPIDVWLERRRRPGYPEEVERHRARLALELPLTPDDVIAQVVRNAADVARRRQRGKKAGEKGGRPSTKPLRVDIDGRFKQLLSKLDHAKARATLVAELAKEHRVSRQTARTWLRDAKIGRLDPHERKKPALDR